MSIQEAHILYHIYKELVSALVQKSDILQTFSCFMFLNRFSPLPQVLPLREKHLFRISPQGFLSAGKSEPASFPVALTFPVALSSPEEPSFPAVLSSPSAE